MEPQEAQPQNYVKEDSSCSVDAQTEPAPSRDSLTCNPNIRRSNIVTQAPNRYSAFALTLHSIAGSGQTDGPVTYDEAVSSTSKYKWVEAMDEELRGIAEKGVWSLAEMPPGFKAIGTKWVFRDKLNADGSIQRYKDRLVAKGF